MKIFYLSRAEFPSEVSHTLSIHNLCLAFAKNNSNVLLYGIRSNKGDIASFYGRSSKNLNYKLVRIPSLLKTRVLKWFQLYSILLAFGSIRHIRKFKPDIIYSRLTILELLFVPSDIPIYYEMHSYGVQARRKIYEVIFKLLIKHKNFKKIIVTTVELKKSLEKKYTNIQVVNAPLSAEEPIDLDKKILSTVKVSLFKHDKYKYHIGYTGYLDDTDLRGMSTLIDIADLTNDICIHVVGGSPQMKRLWQTRADERGVSNIHFYGYVSPVKIPYYLACFEVVLAPLKYRPLDRAPTGQNMSPLKLAQYMAYSKAIVASNIPSHYDFLKNGKNAILVQYDATDEWVESIYSILKNKELKAKLENNALEEYITRYRPSIRTNLILNS